MYFECSECQNVVHCERAPFVCPRCGLAGVVFSRVDALAVVQYVLEGDDEPWDLDAMEEAPWYVPHQVRSAS